MIWTSHHRCSVSFPLTTSGRRQRLSSSELVINEHFVVVCVFFTHWNAVFHLRLLKLFDHSNIRANNSLVASGQRGIFGGSGCCFSCIWGERRRIEWCNISPSSWLTNQPTDKPTSGRPSGTKSSDLIFCAIKPERRQKLNHSRWHEMERHFTMLPIIYIASEEIWSAQLDLLNFYLSDPCKKTKGAFFFFSFFLFVSTTPSPLFSAGWCNRWKRFRNVLWEGERSRWGDCCQSVWRCGSGG